MPLPQPVDLRKPLPGYAAHRGVIHHPCPRLGVKAQIGQRYYQPTTGRWTQTDPLNRATNPTDPPEASPYIYVGNDPVNYTDPTGLDAFTDFLDINTGIVGIVAGGCGLAAGLSAAGVITSPGAPPLLACAGIAAGVAGVFVGIKTVYGVFNDEEDEE